MRVRGKRWPNCAADTLSGRLKFTVQRHTFNEDASSGRARGDTEKARVCLPDLPGCEAPWITPRPPKDPEQQSRGPSGYSERLHRSRGSDRTDPARMVQLQNSWTLLRVVILLRTKPPDPVIWLGEIIEPFAGEGGFGEGAHHGWS